MNKTLSPTVRLRRASNLRIRTEAGTAVVITTETGASTRCTAHALAILDLFAQPTEFAAAVQTLQARAHGAQQWIELTSTIVKLFDAGILLDGDDASADIGIHPTRFDSAPIHIAMLNDRARTSAFIDAIREVVRPTDIVVDIGTGTGVLAVAAAQAGARHVYAVEMGPIAGLARQVFAANDVADRVTLIHGRSTDVRLTEPADVLVSEIIGVEPLAEQVLEVFRDARARLLKPRARFIPARLRSFGLPVSSPPGERARRFFGPEAVRTWQEWYGIDFAPLATARPAFPRWIALKPAVVGDWQPMASPLVLADVDLSGVRDLALRHDVHGTATRSGTIDGVLVFFELELSPSVTFSTHPQRVTDSTSWRTAIAMLTRPVPMSHGDPFTVHFRYHVDSPWSFVDLVPATDDTVRSSEPDA